jgi:acylphosphatase
MSQLSLHGYVSGRVQGVGFRAFVRHHAIENGLSGWAKNLTDGRVEFLLCGFADKVDTVKQAIQNGPRWSDVNGLESRIVPFEHHSGFEIS